MYIRDTLDNCDTEFNMRIQHGRRNIQISQNSVTLRFCTFLSEFTCTSKMKMIFVTLPYPQCNSKFGCKAGAEIVEGNSSAKITLTFAHLHIFLGVLDVTLVLG